jgi:serine phosphatase RsbU (regulator of sigma subunit)
MKLRFRTRLTVSVALLTALTVVVMSAVLITIAALSVSGAYWQRGQMLTLLAQRTLSYSSGLADVVTERIGEQMVVSSLLAAELVYVAERPGNLAPEAITARLQNVIDRSATLTGDALVDEFWVTDEEGNAYINTKQRSFTFAEEDSQSGPFLSLLEPGAPPVIQSIKPRSLDGVPYMYVGVSGVDRPRIVQTGVAGSAVESIRDQFHVGNVLQHFLHQEGSPPILTEVTRIAVVKNDGEVIAAAGNPSSPNTPVADEEVLDICRKYLNTSTEPFSMEEIRLSTGQTELAVVVPLPIPGEDLPAALYMQHRTEIMLDLIVSRVKVISLLGLCLILIAVLVSMWLSARLTRPINALMAAVEAFDGKQFGVRANIKKGDKEFIQFAKSFNAMARRIERHDAEMRTEVARRERLESEMRIGAQVQQDLLPDLPPATRHLGFAGWSIPAIQVGGDFYDYSELSPHRLSLSVGDATGKGLGAALLTTECASVLRASIHQSESPAGQLALLNTALHRHLGPSGRFVTLFNCVIDTEAATLTYSSAGHNPAIVVGPRAVCTMTLLDEGGGLPLGIEANSHYTDSCVDIESGCSVVLYSDGVTEAHNEAGELFGMERLKRVLEENRAASPEGLCKAVRDALHAYTAGVEQHDDMTLVIIRFEQEASSGEVPLEDEVGKV